MIIQPAERLNETKEYYFSLKLKEIKRMNDAGIDVINLGIGNPDLPPSDITIQKLIEAVQNPKYHGYQSYVGLYELRKAFAEKYNNLYKVALDPDTEILPLLGSKEGIIHICLAFANPGDEILVPNPGYPTYSSASRLAGANIRYYDLKEDRGWYPDFKELGKQDLSKVKILWLNYPNMPTGAPATDAVFEEAIEFALEHKILLAHDNPYSSILNINQLSILKYPRGKEVAIELNSMSKSHNMAGWRVGLVAGHADYLHNILKVKSNVDSGTFLPIQIAAIEALNNPSSWHQEQNEIYSRRRAIIWKILDNLGASFDKNQVGMFVWAKIPSRFQNSAELADYFLQKAHVFVTPGFIFGSNGEGYLRISVCTEEERLEEALERIKAIMI